MNIVSDTNIFLAVALDEPEKHKIIEITSEINIIAPEVLPYEIGNALSAMVKRKRISNDEALSVLNTIGRITVKLSAIDIQESLKIAIKFNIYAYDAYFIQCAKAISCPLITLDKRMKQVASKLDIKVLEVN